MDALSALNELAICLRIASPSARVEFVGNNVVKARCLDWSKAFSTTQLTYLKLSEKDWLEDVLDEFYANRRDVVW